MKFHGLSEKRIIEVEKILNKYEIAYLADKDEDAISSFLSIEENSKIDPNNVIIMTLEIPESEIKPMHPQIKQLLRKHNIILDQDLFAEADLDIHKAPPKPKVDKSIIYFLCFIIVFSLIGILINIK
jgi:hypothetical protein